MKPRLFFVHIQKTAGGTLREYISKNLPLGSIYPDEPHEIQTYDYYWNIEKLRNITPKRMSEIQAFVGHFPYIAAELIDVPITTLTVLREPVERTISYLKMRSNDPGKENMTLEDIYDDPFDFPAFIHNHQTKIFAMQRGGKDSLRTFMDNIDITSERLEFAKRKLKKIDILGIQEDFKHVFDILSEHMTWPKISVENQHVSTGEYTISDSLRARIAADNAADVEFYKFGKKLYERRKSDANALSRKS